MIELIARAFSKSPTIIFLSVKLKSSSSIQYPVSSPKRHSTLHNIKAYVLLSQPQVDTYHINWILLYPFCVISRCIKSFM